MTKKPFLRVAYLGDSHCNGGYGLGSLNWRNRITSYLLNFYDVVEAHQFCSGGETIGSTMPDDFVIDPPYNTYSQANPIVGRNITAALAVNPGLILILHSGNHFANGFDLGYTQYLYEELANIMTDANVKFAFSSAGPRMTWFPGSDVDSYRTLCLDFNYWLENTYPNNSFKIWESLTDPGTGLPYADLLLGDYLHYNAEAHLRMKDDTIRFAVPMDEITGYDKVLGLNLQFVDNGDTVTVKYQDMLIKHLNISTSSDGMYFEEQVSEEMSGEREFTVPKDNYIKIVMGSLNNTVTVTKIFE